MAVARPIISLISWVTLAGAIVLQLLTIISGGANGKPENQFYFLEASNIGNIPGARDPSRWTFFAICGVDQATGHNANCGNAVPALPFDPPRNFGTDVNVPQQFIGTHKYYYLSRFMFAFYIIALVFAVLALFTGILACFSRLGGFLSAMMTAAALFFQTIAAALMTSWTVLGRNHFKSNGQNAKLGTKLYAFTWTAVACFLISTILFCCGGALGGRDSSDGISRNRSTRSARSKRSKRSNRGSFFDTESQRRVKDDYS